MDRVVRSRLQFNAAIYQENWSNVQLGINHPTLYGNSEFIVNGPNYRVRGVERDMIWRATDQLAPNASAQFTRMGGDATRLFNCECKHRTPHRRRTKNQ